MQERLQKLLARAGLASRRAAERWIAEGRVTVNGETVTRPGTCVDPSRDAIRVDGKRVPAAPRHHTYLMLNKPRACLTTLSDPRGRRTVADLLVGVDARVFPVGRLDYHTEGLLLLTDDGELARELMHPSRGVPKTYLAKVRGQPGPESLRRLARGLVVDGRRTMPARVRIVERGANARVELTLVEGRKHQVRRMLQAVGLPVMRLRRTGYAGLRLGDLAAGRLRPLTRGELARLRRAPLGAEPPRRRADRG